MDQTISMKSIWYIFLLFPCFLKAQFPPGAGVEGSTAIPADSPSFQAWATACNLERGPLQIDQPELGLATQGIAADAIGMADNVILSLGDGGIATLQFATPIMDGEGWDFAVFENGFAVLDAYFLELAFVEVSSNGIDFVRFPATSLSDTSNQVESFDLLNPEKLHNLAGKYEANYGVPFDLNELVSFPELDIMNITHVRIIDVVGSLDAAYASYDSGNRKINDPWPTPFPSSGFDLDAVGVIHQNVGTTTQRLIREALEVFPNPVNKNQDVWIGKGKNDKIEDFVVIGTNGAIVFHANDLQFPIRWHIPPLAAGGYTLKLKSKKKCWIQRILIMP